jgi:hypothetical protein
VKFTVRSNTRICVLAIILAALPGCGVKPVAGGTTGTLRIGGELLSDIQVTVHEVEGNSAHPVGFGVTDLEGSFELVTNGAHGALWLSPGEYRCTLESAGAPVQFPKEYFNADTTPLKVTWSAGDDSLDLEVPALPPAR